MDGPGTESAATTYTIDDLLETMVALGASDLHVAVGSHPVIPLNWRLDRPARVQARSPRPAGPVRAPLGRRHPAARLPHSLDRATKAPRDQPPDRRLAL